MTRWSGGTWLSILLILAMIVVAGMVAWWVWTQAADLPIGLHGMIALALGTSLSIILAIVLMGLAVKSSRSGHDDEIGHE
ncbi:hypothetical protein SAMN07250955_10619 [Arboricoccus pini]|uniref:Uncharacterized protein n=1 Tax=Arboricoccus pini TaxID=1963835 RepID=A0A212R6S9_9PROT|nr:hypothetical protein [Arboricoccus pini]SNB67685.1 hypothetical protein SAMN07250955_10619 [Arboricoccus pini]